MTGLSPDKAGLANEFGASGRAPESRAAAPRPEDPGAAFDIRIARDGTWHHRGSPINRTPLVKLFATVLRRDAAGDYWLVTPYERGRILVEDAPFTAVELSVAGEGRGQTLRFRTNLDEEVTAGPEHPLRVTAAARGGEPRPYILVWPGLEALILRPVFYQLVELGLAQSDLNEPDGDAGALGVWSQGVRFSLGALAP